MAQGSTDKLREELEAMLRQRDQYSLALDTATDPQAAIRLQRTLDRLEDEIEGLNEALSALPDPEPEEKPTPEGPPQAPDWDDEPATAIFDPDQMSHPAPVKVEERPLPDSDFEKPSDIVTDPGAPLYDLDQPPQQAAGAIKTDTDPGVPDSVGPTGTEPVDVPRVVSSPPPPPEDPENFDKPAAPEVPEDRPGTDTQAAAPSLVAAGVAPPAAAVDPEPSRPEPTIRPEDLPPPGDLPAWKGPPRGDELPPPGGWTPDQGEPGAAHAMPGPDPTVAVTAPLDPGDLDPPTIQMERLRPAPERPSDPLGPVVLDALEPPTGEVPRHPGGPPTDPFAVPGQPPPTQVDGDSPFGSTASDSAAFDASFSSDASPDGEWSIGSKILLALVVGAFLAGVGWVLSQ